MTSYSSKNYQIKPAKGGGVDVGKIDWVIPDFLARGALVLLAAEMGSGKSTLIYRAAEAIYEGLLFLDQLPTKKGEILFAQGYEPKAEPEKSSVGWV